MPRGDWDRPHPNKYQLLADYLAANEGAEVVLTFAQIEVILGDPLSVTAQVSPSWWTEARYDRTRGWRTLGWRARLEQRNRRVLFNRDPEANDA